MKKTLFIALALLVAVAMQAETVTVTASGWATEQGLNDYDDLTTYSQGDVTFTFSQGTSSGSPEYRFSELTAWSGNSLTIVADGKMQALTVNCNSRFEASDLAKSTWSAGTATQGEGSTTERKKCYWTGETDSLVITFSKSVAITQLDITMEATGPGPFVVTFLDMNGGIAKQETVNKGAAATAPILPPPGVDCMQFIGWDKPFNNVKFDMTVSSVYERDTLMLFEPAKYAAEHEDLRELLWENDGSYTYNNFSIGNVTISSVRFTGFSSPEWHIGNTDIIISSTEPFHSLYFECTDEFDAWDFVYDTYFSAGSATSDGSTVIWSGSTNQLTISPFYISTIDITKAYILCQSPDAVPIPVTFYDMDGETVLKVDSVRYMQSATAPTPPEHTGYTFTGWDKDFSSVTEDMHVTAIYTQSSCLDIHKTDWTGYTTQIVGSAANTFSFIILHDTAIISGDFSGGQGWLVLPDLYLQGMQSVTLAFAHSDYCWDEQTDLTLWATANYTGDVTTTQWTKLIIPVDNDIYDPYYCWTACTITLPQAVMGANSAIAFKCYASDPTSDTNWMIRSLELIGTCECSTPPAPNDSLRTDLPEAARLYDMTGNGLKNVLIGANTALKQYSDLTDHFAEQRTLWAGYGAPLVNFVEDINRDGVPDFSVTNNGYYNSLVSNSNGSYNEVRNCIVLHNCDLNNDGRPDYLSFNANQNQFYIQYGQADGTFRQESMLIYTYAQYEQMMEEYNWAELAREQTYSNGTIGLLSVDHSLYAQGLTNMFTSAWLARAPRRAAGIGKTIAMPTKALDFNADGLMDLVDEKTGVVYLNLSQGRWLKEETGGAVVPVDLNGDGILDFVLPGTKVYTAIYTGNGDFELNTIYSDATVDDQLYCYDFDHDGDIDILATFSAAKNSLNTAFTCFFINDGTGHFTQKDANYGTQKLWFTNCQDVDGDGWLDLLAFRGEIDQMSDYHQFHHNGIVTGGKLFPQNTDAVVLRGKADLTFQAPESVCPITELLIFKYNVSQNEGHNVGKMEDLSIEAEDLDGDGKMEIWPTGLNVGYTHINTLENAAANAAPNTPAKPALWYENGILNVSWGNSLDDHTSACDLSYALRIGTTTGGNEILAAHANADGSRRDFLDGNMGKNHSYTIDLTSYAPGTIYVAIQAIDAQHTGSSWSEEATVQHVALPNFTLSKSTVNLNEKVTVSFPALSDGYTQTWSYGNAIKSDETATSMTLSFAESGEKNIMRTITSDGKSSVYSLILTVLPTALGDTIDCPFPYQYLNAADYNYDGYFDYVGADNTVMQSTAINSATQAIALWNTNVKGDVCWLDWNKDGHVDLLLKDVDTYYILAHNGSNSLSTKAEDPTLVSLFTSLWTASLEDALVLETIDNVWQYTGLNLEWNGENVVVPFEQRIAKDDCSEPQLADFNSDGYQDLIAKRNSDGAIYILWNRQNEFFSAPFILPLGDLDSYYRMQDLTLVDVDNNGYLDVTVNAPHKAIHASSTAIYVWYMDAEGLMAQSFINDESNLLIQMPGELFVSNSRYGMAIGSITRVIGNPNLAPTAPMNVRAAQTEEGLLIQWDAATDDHTPTEMLRYNLSVKHAGQSGADAYVISPQNGRHANAAFLPGYEYVNATRYLIPTDQLTAGDYEISLQTIDLRCSMSAFTTPLSVRFDRLVIEAPVTACANVATTVTYMGESSTQTPVWEFDGATILSGTGFGPYDVQWETAGVKTITLTLGTEVYTRTIQIDEAQANVALPSVLFRNHDMTIALPPGHTAAWGLFIGSTYHDVTARGIDNVDPQLTASGNVLHAGDGIGTDITTFNLTLVLTLTNANGCATTIQQAIQIVEEDQLPSIRLVTADADGHHKIEFDVPSSLFPQLQILKETNILNQFVELATVAAADGIYTDLSSNAAQKADRYAVRGVMADGTPAPMSAPHQTVHMTINRGLQEGTYNLIWNGYQGANIVTYNILRGTSDDALTQIASVAASVLSYTDDAPVDEQPIYAIEYVLGTQAANAPRRVMTTATQLSGRSNTANRAESRVVTFVSSMTIHSANGNYATTAETPSLFLYAELMPINATYKTVKWEITSGAELATIDQTGLLTACIPNTGGVVTVKATATDGTGVYATKQINIAPIDGTIPPQPVYYTILFVNWDNTELQRSQVLEGEVPVYEGITPVRPEDEQYIYTFNGWTPTIVAVTADATYTATYEAKGKSVGIEDIFFDASSAPRKVLIDNVIYILRGEKKYTITGVEVK